LFICKSELAEFSIDPASTSNHHRVICVCKFCEGILLKEILSVCHVVFGHNHVSSKETKSVK
jgi:hypothetical protein